MTRSHPHHRWSTLQARQPLAAPPPLQIVAVEYLIEAPLLIDCAVSSFDDGLGEMHE
jgi:hypothetical protein